MPDQTCIFCRIVAGEIPAQVIYEDEACLAFRDINPQAPVHVLVIPRKHITSLAEASADDAAPLGRVLLACAEIARAEGLGESGFRTVINTGANAGQSVFHIHAHVLGNRPLNWPPG